MTTDISLKRRSPNYPAIDLAEAIVLLKKLYAKVQRGEFTDNDAALAWGYKSVSGPMRSKLAALKQYGLVSQEKGRHARLSQRALTLLLRNEASNEHIQAKREAALAPPLFRELEPRLSSTDDVLKHHLIVERKFTDDGASRLIEVFRASMRFASVTDRDSQSGQGAGIPEEKGAVLPQAPEGKLPASEQAKAGYHRVVLPLLDGRTATIELPRQMSEDTWKHFTDMLNLLKLGLVTEAKKGI